MVANKQDSERGKPWTPEVLIQAFKEIVTALLGLLIVGYALSMARNALSVVGEQQKMSDAKDALLLLLGLAGVVVAYYFGRVPADARASQAQEQANAATAQAEQINAQARVIADEPDAGASCWIRLDAPASAKRGGNQMTPEGTDENTEKPGTRQLVPVIPASDYAHRDRWAIIVGISEYENERWNLKYAHRDAEEFYKLIRRPSGGGFEAGHIFRLISEEATTRNIYKALCSFLKKPAPEDVILFYLACHGAPDPDRPENVCLITYDTDPDLGQQTELQPVFLNDCSTQRQVNDFPKAKGSAVIATSRAIDDQMATDFAIQFYPSLASGAGLRRTCRRTPSTTCGCLAGSTRGLLRPGLTNPRSVPVSGHAARGADCPVLRPVGSGQVIAAGSDHW